MSWDSLKAHIDDVAGRSNSWESDRRSLHKIFDKAAEWGLNSQYAWAAPVSNLRVIVSEAKRAIRWEDKEALESIFIQAASMTNIELRLALHLPELEDIAVEPAPKGYRLEVTPQQYERLRSSTRLAYRFQEAQPAMLQFDPEYQ